MQSKNRKVGRPKTNRVAIILRLDKPVIVTLTKLGKFYKPKPVSVQEQIRKYIDHFLGR